MKLIDMSKYDDYPKSLRKNKYKFIICMLAISVVSFAVFYVYVNINSILLAFKEFVGYADDGTSLYKWSFENYRKIFAELSGGNSATSLLLALRNTLLLFFCGNAVAFPMGCVISYYLWKKIRGYKFFRSVFYIPSVLSSVVMVLIYKNMVAPNGLISTINIALKGVPIPSLLQQDSTAIWMILVYNTWVGFAGDYILLTGALMRIPEEIIESAKLDGASPVIEYFRICIPLCWPTLYIILIQKIAGVLSADGPILLMTQGAHNTTTLGYWSYSQIFINGSYEYASAVGLLMTLVIAPIAITAKNLLGRVYKDVEF